MVQTSKERNGTERLLILEPQVVRQAYDNTIQKEHAPWSSLTKARRSRGPGCRTGTAQRRTNGYAPRKTRSSRLTGAQEDPGRGEVEEDGNKVRKGIKIHKFELYRSKRPSFSMSGELCRCCRYLAVQGPLFLE